MSTTTPLPVLVGRQAEVIDELRAALNGLLEHIGDCAKQCSHPECKAVRAARIALSKEAR